MDEATGTEVFFTVFSTAVYILLRYPVKVKGKIMFFRNYFERGDPHVDV